MSVQQLPLDVSVHQMHVHVTVDELLCIIFALLTAASNAVAAVLLVADLLVVCVSVLLRFLFNAPVEWADDVARGLMVGSSFFGAASARFADQPSAPAPSGPSGDSGQGPDFDVPVGRHAGLEGGLTSSSRPVYDGAVGDHEGGSVPGTGAAGAASFNNDPPLV